jgi:CheY-like chemotaxis protein
MPNLDGYDATREIRRGAGDGSRTPIIAMTASAMRGDRELCLAAGMDDYLSKPLRLEELDRVLDEWVRPSDAGGGPAAGPAADGAPDPLAYLRDAVGDEDLVREVVELFCEDAVIRVADLEGALASGDAEVLRRAAHALKGSAANVGASEVSRLAHRVELHGKAGRPDDARPLVARLQHEVARTTVELRASLGCRREDPGRRGRPHIGAHPAPVRGAARA